MTSKKKQEWPIKKHDTFILQCPNPTCKGGVTPYCINSEYASETTYGLENAPLFAVAEVNHWARLGTVNCIHCGCSIYLEVCYAVKTRMLSDRERENFNENKSWKIA